MGVVKWVHNMVEKFDISKDTVRPEYLLKGITAHGADGEPMEGTLDRLAYTRLSEDLIPAAIDKDGSIMDGCGYKDGYRWSVSAKDYTAYSGVWSTGFIEIDPEDTLVLRAENGRWCYAPEYVLYFNQNFEMIVVTTQSVISEMLVNAGKGDKVNDVDQSGTSLKNFDFTTAKYVVFAGSNSLKKFTVHKVLPEISGGGQA